MVKSLLKHVRVHTGAERDREGEESRRGSKKKKKKNREKNSSNLLKGIEGASEGWSEVFICMPARPEEGRVAVEK